MREIRQSENPDQFMELPNSWEERGIRKARKEIALEMLKEDLSTEFIAKVTQLDIETIEKLQSSN